MAKTVRGTEVVAGGYFTHEYSLEAAALFNPRWCRTWISRTFRRIVAVHPEFTRHGEGHVSSIAFRSGILDANSNITMDLPSRYSLEPMQVPNSTFEKPCSNGSFRNSISWATSTGRFSTAYRTHSQWKSCAPASVALQHSSRSESGKRPRCSQRNPDARPIQL